MKNALARIRTPLVSALLAAAGLPAAAQEHPSGAPPFPPAPAPGPSLAWADLDADGLADLAVVSADGTLRLLRGAGDGGFEERSELLAGEFTQGVRQALWADHDADGHPDLFLVSEEGRGRLLRNERGVGFVDATIEAGLDPELRVQRAVWVDHDGDGAPDLVLLSPDGSRFHENRGDGTFATAELPVALGLETESPASAAYAPPVETAAAPVVDTARGGGAEATARAGSADGAAPGGSRRVALGSGVGAMSPSLGDPVQGGPVAPLSLGSCADSLRDQAGLACLTASSLPVLGSLYPLSPDLFVSPSGFVGLNTTSPSRRLEIVDGQSLFRMRSTSNGFGSIVELQNDTASPTLLGGFNFRRSSGIAGQLVYRQDDTFQFNIAGKERMRIESSSAFLDGPLDLGYDAFGNGSVATFELQPNSGGSGATVRMHPVLGPETVTLQAYDSFGQGAALRLRKLDGSDGVTLMAADPFGNASVATDVLVADSGITTGSLQADSFKMRNGSGTPVVQFDVNTSSNGTGQIVLFGADGLPSIVIDGDVGGTGSRLTTDVLEITGGADLVEGFATGERAYAPGTVLVIDSERPGHLTASRGAYDTRVAGVVSGAGGVEPGLRMGQSGVLDGETPVALTGRVYVRCSAENGPIRPGDRLTTAELEGHAMRADDPERAPGATLGKAMTALEAGDGLVLVLVNLQ